MLKVKNIVVAADGSGSSGRAAEYAAVTGKALDARIHLVHVFPRTPMDLMGMHGPSAAMVGIDPFDEKTFRKLWDDAAKHAFDMATKAMGGFEGEVEKVSLGGDPSTEIVNYADGLPSPIIFIGHRGLGRIAGALMGSVSQRVIHHAHCPVLIVQ